MRIASWFFSFIMHAGILFLVLFWGDLQAPPIKLDVPVYHVDLVSLPGAPGLPGAVGKPSPAKKPEVKPETAGPKKTKTAPPPPDPKPKTQPKKPPVQDKVEAKPVPAKKVAKPKPKTEPKTPPKPEKGKDISQKKKDKPKKKPPEKKKNKVEKPKQQPKKAQTKKKPAVKPKKKPKNVIKTEQAPNRPPTLTKEQILAEALRTAQKDSAKQDKMNADQLAEALKDVGQMTSPENAASPGTGGQMGNNGTGGQLGAYARALASIVKSHWRFPNLADKQVFIAVVEIRIDRRGQIIDYSLKTPSGRPDFDASALKAVDETQQFETLPEPPKGQRIFDLKFNSQEQR